MSYTFRTSTGQQITEVESLDDAFSVAAELDRAAVEYIVWVSDSLTGDPSFRFTDSDGKSIVIRHDVDSAMDVGLRMQEQGVACLVEETTSQVMTLERFIEKYGMA